MCWTYLIYCYVHTCLQFLLESIPFQLQLLSKEKFLQHEKTYIPEGQCEFQLNTLCVVVSEMLLVE